MSKSKGELSALFRLEFYRKQKKWKFSCDIRKEKADKKKAKTLDTTYNVEQPIPDPEESVLNQAFVDSGPGSEEVSTCGHHEIQEDPSPVEKQGVLEPQHLSIVQDTKQPTWPPDLDSYELWPDPPITSLEGHIDPPFDCEWQQWVNQGLQEVDDMVRELEMAGYHEQESHDMVSQEFLQESVSIDTPPLARDCESEFMRGAHHVAHSSDNECDDDLDEEWVSSAKTLACLPERNLLSHLVHTTRTLRLIYAEARERELLKDCVKLRDQLVLNNNVEEPTRDVGMLPEEFIAGSHLCYKNGDIATLNVMSGRGRGRSVTLTVNMNLTTLLKLKSIKPFRLYGVPKNYTYILLKNITLILAQSGKKE